MAVNVAQIQRQSGSREKDPLDTLSQVAQVGATIYGATKGGDTKSGDTMENAVKSADAAMGPDKNEAMTRRMQSIDYMNGKRWG